MKVDGLEEKLSSLALELHILLCRFLAEEMWMLLILHAEHLGYLLYFHVLSPSLGGLLFSTAPSMGLLLGGQFLSRSCFAHMAESARNASQNGP